MNIESGLREKLLRLTFEELQDLRRRSSKARGSSHPPLLAPGRRKSPIPLSFAQLRLWFIHQHMLEQTTYNIPMALNIHGQLNIQALRDAFNVLIARHEILRTSFRQNTESDEPEQVISENFRLDIPLIEATLEQVEQYGQAHDGHIFDLTQLPLLKVTVLRVQADEHIILITMHHIISDMWSMGIMSRELSQVYRALNQGERVELPALTIQYADYACWQRELDLQPHLKYWQDSLATYVQGLQLPCDHARPPERTWRAGCLRYRFPISLSQEVFNRAQGLNSTPFMVLLSALSIVLYLYTGRRDLVIGTTTAGRNSPDVEPLLGVFVNILPLRINLTEDPTGTELLRQARAVTIGALEHQALPFEQLLSSLKLTRERSESPLVPVMLRHQNLPTSVLSISDSPPTEVGYQSERKATTELDLQFFGDGNGLEASVEYAADLFQPTTVNLLLAQFEWILSQLLQNPERRVSQIAVLSYSQVSKLQLEWNKTERPLDCDVGISRLFELQVQQTPHQTACIDTHNSWTYSKLNARANKIARYLQDRGMNCASRVAVYARRSPEFLAAVLGIWKAGLVYVPIDPKYPTSYVDQILLDAQPALILTSKSLMAGVVDRAETTCLDDISLDAVCSDDLAACVLADQPAYLAYTSGSTGKPKGVLVPHRQIINWLESLRAKIPFETDEVVAQKTSQAFVVSVKEQFAGLLCGVPQVILADELLTDIPALVCEFERERISRINLVPSHLQALLDELDAADERMRSLKHCIVAGEPCTPCLIDLFRTKLPHASLWNNYGCTETNDITYADPRELQGDDSLAPIGRPISNTKLYVLGQMYELVPIGVVGELCVDTISMPYGYWNQPRLTAERFIPNPFAPRHGSRLYRTGDLARYRHDGQLELVGRVDFDIKIRGNRADVRQIEYTLEQCPGIERGVVKAITSDVGGTTVAAYYIHEATSTQPSKEVVRAFMTERLPGYMVPTYFVPLQALPRLPNGKVDRRALPTPGAESLSLSEYAPARGETQHRMVQVWSRLLGVQPERVGIHDDFFALGGHSLLAVSLMAKIRAEFRVDLPISAVFQTPTVAGICSRLALSQFDGAAANGITVRPIDRQLEAPLSLSQEHVWSLHRRDPALSSVDNVSWCFRVAGNLCLRTLQEAFRVLVNRHEILRTTFHQVAGQAPIQRIATEVGRDIPVIDMKPEQVRQYVVERAAEPMSLDQLPIFSVVIVRLSADEYLLVIKSHHMICDGWSRGIIARELSEIYRSLVKGESPQLAPLPIQYADFACWQRSLDLRPQLHYWQQLLKDHKSYLLLPYDHAPSQKLIWSAGHLRWNYPTPLYERLRQLGRAQHATLFMVLLSAFTIALAKYVVGNELVVGTTTGGRDAPDVEHLIGYFVNVLPLTIDMGSGPTFIELVERVKKATIDAIENQPLPFREVASLLRPGRPAEESAVIPIMFRHQNFPAATFDVETDLEIQPVSFSDSRFDRTLKELDFQFFDYDGRLEADITYAVELFEHSTVERILGAHESILWAIAENPNQSVSQLREVLTGNDTEKIANMQYSGRERRGKLQ